MAVAKVALLPEFSMQHKTRNFLTFDIEEWYHANYDSVDFQKHTGQKTNLEPLVDRLIDLCGKYNVKSTCFVLGSVAENNPRIVTKLRDAGHEIASHGYGHKLVYTMTPKEFKEDLKRSCDILENITGEKVLGFRAPSWSIKSESLLWYYLVLEELELKYSSSVYPGQTFLYGIPGFPEKVHYPMVQGEKVNILEIPVSLVNIMGKKLGFSGGFYLRFFPTWFVLQNIKKKNADNEPVFVYLHPREIDKNQPKLELPLKEKLIHYCGINSCENKLDRLIKTFSATFIRMSDMEQFVCENNS